MNSLGPFTRMSMIVAYEASIARKQTRGKDRLTDSDRSDVEMVVGLPAPSTAGEMQG